MSAPGSHRLTLVAPRRVAVLRALPGLGDMLCLVPALRALRAALPEARIELIGLPWAAGLVPRFHGYLDDVVEFPGFPGIPEAGLDLPRFAGRLAALQRRHYDVLLQMHGNGRITNIFAELVGASFTAGFYLPGNYCPNPETFLPYPTTEPEVRRHLRLIEFLDIPPQGEHLEFEVSPADEQELAEVAPARPYVCLHPGARDEQRRWAPDHFAAVGQALAGRGLEVVLTGSAGERPATRAVAQGMAGCRPLDLTAKTSLGSLAALLRGARLLVSNDTGVSHLAAALGTPSVVVFAGPDADPARWAPLDTRRHRVVVDRGRGAAVAATTRRAVLDAAEQLLAKDWRRDG